MVKNKVKKIDFKEVDTNEADTTYYLYKQYRVSKRVAAYSEAARKYYTAWSVKNTQTLKCYVVTSFDEAIEMINEGDL